METGDEGAVSYIADYYTQYVSTGAWDTTRETSRTPRFESGGG